MIFIVLGISLLIAIMDQTIKFFVQNNIEPSKDIVLIDNLLSLTYVENKGAAFGILADKRFVFILATLFILAVFVYIIVKRRIVDTLFNVSAILIIGGGLGNMIDRVFRGYVIDYIKLSFFPPVCNLADYCISIGVVILAVKLLTDKNSTSQLK